MLCCVQHTIYSIDIQSNSNRDGPLRPNAYEMIQIATETEFLEYRSGQGLPYTTMILHYPGS